MPTIFTGSSATTTGPLTPVTGFLGSPSDAIALAHDLVADARTQVLQLTTLAGTLTAPSVSVDLPVTDVPPASDVPTLPSLASAVWISPALPTAFSGSLDVSDLMPDPFDEAAPVLTFATAPAAFSELAPDSPSVNTTFADPTLSLTLPTAPDLLSISVSPFAGVTMPTFDAVEPTLNLAAPTIREYTPGAQYTSGLLTSLRDSLQYRIDVGGTGLSPDVENAIWDRGREREARAQADAIAKLEQMEGLGYAFPPGVYLDARIKIITETDYAERGHSREVMIKAAELELDNVKHALTTATSIEGSMIQYANQVEQRLFDATKYATEAGIAIYNAQAQVFAQLVEVYKTKVQIYTAQIQAEIAKVDAYKAQIEAEQAKAQINTALVEQYKVQAEIAAYSIDIYKAQLAGIQTKAEIEKMKIEIFGEQVKAYATKVNAYTAGVEAYRATLEAEKTKQEAYTASVQAFSTKVEAAAKQIDARIAVFKGLIDAKTIEWDGYKATVQGESARIQGIVAGNSSLTDLYKSEVTGYASLNDNLTKQWQVVQDRNTQLANLGIQAAKANAELYVSSRSLVSDATKISAQVSGQLGAAALNAMTWSNSIQQHYGQSNTYSSGDSNSFQFSYGFEERYNHNLTE